MVEEYIEKIRPIIAEMFSKESSGHDISHLERVMKLALYLQEKEGGDRIVVGIAGFLHDVHRLMQNERQGEFVPPKDSLPMIRNILSNVDLSNDQIEKICYAIENHELYNWNNNNITDINTLILQDADNLDAIGAIGIARCFKYCGAHGVAMYEPSIPLIPNTNYEEKGHDVSGIHHFYNKLLRLGKYMNTNTAKEIAEKRTNFMNDFVQTFLKEWKAEV